MFIDQQATCLGQDIALFDVTGLHCSAALGKRGSGACTFPYSLMTLPGSGLGLTAIPAENVGTLLLLGMTLTVGDTSMKMGDAFTFVGEALIPAAEHSQPLRFRR